MDRIQGASMILDGYEINHEQARIVRPRLNLQMGIFPARRPAIPGITRNRDNEFVVLSIAANAISQDVVIPRAAWEILRKCRCVFDDNAKRED